MGEQLILPDMPKSIRDLRQRALKVDADGVPTGVVTRSKLMWLRQLKVRQLKAQIQQKRHVAPKVAKGYSRLTRHELIDLILMLDYIKEVDSGNRDVQQLP